MKPSSPPPPKQGGGLVYERSALSYANSFDSPLKSSLIRSVEWMTGKLRVVQMIREFERRGPFEGQAFWRGALDVMGVDIRTPEAEIAHIPATGPAVLVANHPHGMVDGMVLAELIGRRRKDYRILTRSLLTGLDNTASQFLIPVPFPDRPEAQEQMVEMRRQAMAHLQAGGLVAVFPSGVVATSDSFFGPVVERDWNVFTAKMIRQSRAAVVPCFFPGANSRIYQMAHQISATLRQSLLIHEIVRARNKAIRPVIGPALSHDDLADRLAHPRRCMGWLREETLGLARQI